MFLRGSKPIDGLWISSNIDISNACVMPFGYRVGNHRAFILDIPIESLVGVDPVKKQVNDSTINYQDAAKHTVTA